MSEVRPRRASSRRRALLTPTSIKFNRFVKLILIKPKPLLACFGFVTRQKWLVSRKFNLRKRLNLIDVGAELQGWRMGPWIWGVGCRVPALGVGEVRVASVDDDVARLEARHDLRDELHFGCGPGIMSLRAAPPVQSERLCTCVV